MEATTSSASFRVSLLAVPLPMAMASMAYFMIMSFNLSEAWCHFPMGMCGYIGSKCIRPPVWSKHTTLHPVLYPGSMPIVLLCPSGGDSSNCLRFSAKTAIASLSAFSLLILANSVSMDGFISLLYASSIAFSTIVRHLPLLRTNILFRREVHSSSLTLILTLNIPMLSPLLMARSLWDEHFPRDSSQSK